MSTRNTRATDYSNTSGSGLTAGEAVRHPIDAAKEAMSSNSGTHSGVHTGTAGHTGEAYSTGRGGAGNIAGANTGTTGTTGGLTESYGSQPSTGAGLMGAGAGAGLAGEHHGHHHGHHGQHTTGTHVPGNALGTGDGRLPGTGTTGTHTSHTGTTGYETGRGGAGNIAEATTAAGTTGHHAGTHTGAHTGSHTGSSTVEGDHKPTMGEKIKGAVETMTGKMTNDPERVAAGQQLKEGTHPSQTGSSATGTGSGRHGGI